MPKLPGINHLDAIRALEKAGFQVRRQGKHVAMTDGSRIVTVPRHNPINAYTMATIALAAGLTIDEFRMLL
jgi:predicted RNA binding protein YcfA (HicA-like mRNA interferase family)